MTVTNEIDDTQVTTRFIGRKNTHEREGGKRHSHMARGSGPSSDKKGRAMEEVEWEEKVGRRPRFMKDCRQDSQPARRMKVMEVHGSLTFAAEGLLRVRDVV